MLEERISSDGYLDGAYHNYLEPFSPTTSDIDPKPSGAAMMLEHWVGLNVAKSLELD